jgi:TP901 family phage tail tape measure protein
VSLNFDAQINLNIEPFITSIERAEKSVQALDAQINALNTKKAAATNTVGSDMGSRKAAAEQVMAQQRLEQAADRSAKAQIAAQNKIDKAHGEALKMNEEFDRKRQGFSDQDIRNKARERYALYDVAAAYQQVSQAAFGAVRAMAGTAIEYERSFANVRRTTEFTSHTVGAAADAMKYSLTQVAAEIPIAFGKVTEIATIGNQLGIAQGQLASFSKTVAQFSATTGITTEATAMGFGRIGELLNEQDYNKLGSSIAFAGVKAVATEEQIVSVTKEIATTAKMAKFTTPEVVGLATALASVGIAPEAARGSIMRTFAGINQAVGMGGADLENYAKIAGMSAEDFAKSWQTNGEKAFGSFVQGLQGMSDSGQNLDTVLRNLGLRNVRDIQTIQKLGDNYDVYAESIKNASSAFNEGTFLSESYAVIQDTVAAKIDLIRNNVDNLMATLGEGATGEFFKSILDQINSLLERMNDVARSPLGQFIAPFVLALTTAVGVLAAINAALALGKAAMFAYYTATVGTSAALSSMSGAAVAASVGLRLVATAMRTVPWLAGISVAITAFEALASAMTPVEQKAESLIGGFAGLQDAVTSDTAALEEYAKANKLSMQEAAKATGVYLVNTGAIEGNDQAAKDATDAHNNLLLITGQEPDGFNASAGAIANQTLAIGQNTIAWMKNALAQSSTFQDLAKNKEAMAALSKGGYDFEKLMEASARGNASAYIKTFKDSIVLDSSGENWWKNTPLGGFEQYNIGNAKQALQNLADAAQGVSNQVKLLGIGADTATKSIVKTGDEGTDSFNNFNKAVEKTKKAIRTVVDYASDLGSIFKRIDEIQFSRQTGLDEITSQWQSLKDSAKEAADAIKKAETASTGLKADRGVLEYQLSVAVRYGDEKRAAVLRDQIAKKTEAIAEAEADKKKAQDASSTSLTGNTQAAIKNRASLVGMLGKYQEYITALAATGVKGHALTKEIEDQKAKFKEEAAQLGFNATELELYTKQFDSYANTVKTTPRDVNVEFSATKDAEFNAVQEYLAKEQKLDVKVVMKNNGVLDSIGGTKLYDYSKTGQGNPGGPSGNPTPTPSVNETKPVVDPGGATQTTSALKSIMNESIRLQTLLKSPKISYSAAVGLSNQVQSVQALYKELSNIQKQMSTNSYLSMAALAGLDARRREIIENVAAKKFATGGSVYGSGSSNSDSVPAMLSNGEFVMRASAVKTYGLDFMNSLNQAKVGFQPSGGSGSAGGGSQMVYLSPDDRALLRAAIERPVNLYSDNTRLASSTNAGNVALAQRGVN